jgi:glutathione-regulated potassium-efflux system protein KefB
MVAYLGEAVVLLAAGAAAAPLARKAGMASAAGYLLAGLLLGPSLMGVIAGSDTILGVAELGIVLILFLVGLELEPSRLAAMRTRIINMGVVQVVACTAVFAAGASFVFGLPIWSALLVGYAFALSATALAFDALHESGAFSSHSGQRTVATLVVQDFSVVPVLTVLALTGSQGAEHSQNFWLASAYALAAIGGVYLIGRYALAPIFRLLASSGSRETMTASALFLVLGTALLMQHVGLSMALGAFLAGVLLSQSTFRHELEADIEPFRGLLIGLFFIGLGLDLNLQDIRPYLPQILGLAMGVLTIKALLIFVIARLTGASPQGGLRTSGLLLPAGEFAFVLLPLLAKQNFLSSIQADIFIAASALSLILGPFLAKGMSVYASYLTQRAPVEGQDGPDGIERQVLMIGFGRFGQLSAQCLLSQGVDVTIIENDVDMIRSAQRFGFRVYYGDGLRLDVLRAAGAEKASLIALCIDDKVSATRITSIIKTHFPLAKCFVRAFDRAHVLELRAHEPDFIIRELLESALAFGKNALEALGFDSLQASSAIDDVRERDAERLRLQMQAGDTGAGRHMMHVRPVVQPEPLLPPREKGKIINDHQDEDEIEP